MGSDQTLQGRVESIAAGIEDRDRSAGATLLANVNPTFNWVRLAQRVPVRIALDHASAANSSQEPRRLSRCSDRLCGGMRKDSHCRACPDFHLHTSELLDQTNFGLGKCW